MLAAARAALVLASTLAIAQHNEQGKALTFDVGKGNCLACHMIPGDAQALTSANIGPPLVAMKQRYPERERLRAQIWDATRANPNTVMPPFGKHRVLTEQEIDHITDYVHGL